MKVSTTVEIVGKEHLVASRYCLQLLHNRGIAWKTFCSTAMPDSKEFVYTSYWETTNCLHAEACSTDCG